MKFYCPEKQKAREAWWQILSVALSFKKPQAIFMPHTNRAEYDVALRAGWLPQQLIAVDNNPAVLANFTRKLNVKEKKATQRMAVQVSEAAQRLHKRGLQVGAASLDFCGNVDSYRRGSVRSELDIFALSRVMAEGFVVVNVLNAREASPSTEAAIKTAWRTPGISDLADLSRFERGRLHLLWAALSRGFPSACVIACGKYTNTQTRMPMLWAAFELRKRT